MSRLKRQYLPHGFLLLGQSQEVLAGIDVPVVDGAALRTSPFPDVQGFLAVAVTAGGTDLAGRIELVRSDERPSFPFGLVGQVPAELGPAGFRDAFGQPVVLHQVGTAQRLNNEDLVFVRHFVGELMKEMLALISDLFMFFGQCQAGLFPVFAAFFLARQRPLGFLDLPFRLAQALRVPVLHQFVHIVGGDSKIGKTQVDTDFMLRRHPFGRFLLDQNGDEVFAGLRHGNRARLDEAIKIPMLPDFDEADFRQLDFFIFDADVSALVVGRIG